jgi:TonB family protein
MLTRRGVPSFMHELKRSIGNGDDSALSVPVKSGSREQNQRRMMLVALMLLIVALGLVIYRDRDFWFPDSGDADDLDPVPATVTIQTQPVAPTTNSAIAEKSGVAKSQARHHSKEPAASTPDTPQNSAAPLVASNDRAVLPPLEVEVVAGDYHRQVHPATNSLHVDLQPNTSAQGVPVSTDPNAANMNAAENLRISTEAAAVVSQPVRPGYPVLARQMKVQGSVILQALIGRDGLIQNLHVLTGPPILADAAEEAVRQWRFKPHYLNNQPVETQTSITVNFTISTN